MPPSRSATHAEAAVTQAHLLPNVHSADGSRGQGREIHLPATNKARTLQTSQQDVALQQKQKEKT
jgi:hypothetical protein